jgi:acylphosphatase
MQSSNQFSYKKLNIEGRVQGVFYRRSTLKQASKLGLVGRVQNLPNGSVQVEVKGREEQVNKLVDWLIIGPPMASVKKVTEIELNQVEKDDLDKLTRFFIFY